MNRKKINENVKRKLYAESMGRCMNPHCQKELFRINGDIIEKAHIYPYCKTADNYIYILHILTSKVQAQTIRDMDNYNKFILNLN